MVGDEEIAEVARAWGAEVPFMHPAALAQDNSDHISVVVHATQWLEEDQGQCPDYVMLLQPASPLRTAEDMAACIEIAQEKDAPAVISVYEAPRHPYLIKQAAPDGTLVDFVSSNIAYLRRQALPVAYALNGAIYLNRSQSLLQTRTFLPPGTYRYIMPAERSLDVDTPWDFHLVDLILRVDNSTSICL